MEYNIKELIEKTKGPDLPGGGSISAYVASLGTALTMMVRNLSIDKKSYLKLDKDIRDSIDRDYEKLDSLSEDLYSLYFEDTKSFDRVLDAWKLPKDAEEEKAIREKAVLEGYKYASSVPLRISKLCIEALKLQKNIAKYGNINAITDQGIGSLLLASSGESALLNVIINIKYIKDEDLVRELNLEVENCKREINALKEEMLGICYKRLED